MPRISSIARSSQIAVLELQVPCRAVNRSRTGAPQPCRSPSSLSPIPRWAGAGSPFGPVPGIVRDLRLAQPPGGRLTILLRRRVFRAFTLQIDGRCVARPMGWRHPGCLAVADVRPDRASRTASSAFTLCGARGRSQRLVGGMARRSGGSTSSRWCSSRGPLGTLVRRGSAATCRGRWPGTTGGRSAVIVRLGLVRWSSGWPTGQTMDSAAAKRCHDALTRAKAYIGARAPADVSPQRRPPDAYTISPGSVYRSCAPNAARHPVLLRDRQYEPAVRPERRVLWLRTELAVRAGERA